MDKRIFYETLYKAFYPESVVAFATINGYKVCKNDSQMVDYDVLYAIDPSMESKTWIQITEFDKVPRIIIKINGFFVEYKQGDTFESIEKQKPSILKIPQDDQAWVRVVYSAIYQAFISAGYVIK